MDSERTYDKKIVELFSFLWDLLQLLGTYPQRAETAAVLVHGHQPIDVLIRLGGPRFAGGTRLNGTAGAICLPLADHRRSSQFLGGHFSLLCKEKRKCIIN